MSVTFFGNLGVLNSKYYYYHYYYLLCNIYILLKLHCTNKANMSDIGKFIYLHKNVCQLVGVTLFLVLYYVTVSGKSLSAEGQ